MPQSSISLINPSVYEQSEARSKQELEEAANKIVGAMRFDCSGRGKLLEKLYKDTRTILETYK